MTYHRIGEEWLLKLEQKLHLVSLKEDRLQKRLNNVLAVADRDHQLFQLKQETDISINNGGFFLTRLLRKLALKFRR